MFIIQNLNQEVSNSLDFYLDCSKLTDIRSMCRVFGKTLNVTHDFHNLDALRDVLEDLDAFMDISKYDGITFKLSNSKLFLSEDESIDGAIVNAINIFYTVSTYWASEIGSDNFPKKKIIMRFVFEA